MAAAGVTAKMPGPDTRLDAGRQRRADGRSSGHARLRQWRRARIPPHHRGRRQISVHRSRTRSPNKGSAPVTLFPYALISRHGTPQTLGYYILHEGLIGVLGDQGLQEKPTPNIDEKKDDAPSTSPMPGSASPTNTGRRRCCPTPTPSCRRASPSGTLGATRRPTRPIICSISATIAPGATGTANARLFAGAKEVSRLVDGYDKALKLNRFELLIDWGWFYFITKPMFLVIDWLYPAARQFRHRHPARHRPDQDRCSSRSPTSPTPRWRR